MSDDSTTVLTNFWAAHSELWFDAKPEDDAFITVLFQHYKIKDDFEAVLYYDQIMRHICRFNSINYDPACIDHALSIAERIIDNPDYSTPFHQVFLMLPFRHKETIQHIEYVRDRVLKLMAHNDSPLYVRFYRATITRLAKLSKAELIANPTEPDYMFAELIDESSKFDPESVDQVKDLKDLPNVPKFDKKPTVISLSGGVDSMVCLKLALLQKLDVVAVHINYGNRPTADEEQHFLEWYCAKVGVPLYVRKITEIRRTRDHLRDFYEKITKDIRFAAYRQFPGRSVILGHNQTDCEENIITNIKKWRNLDNLIGMNEYSEIDGVTIYRPMLGVSKREMYRIAEQLNVPYLPNSTPSWSERGKIRDRILPVLDDTTRQRLLDLSDYITSLHETVKAQVDSIEITRTNSEISFMLTSPTKIIFELLFRRLELYSISVKNIEHMVERFKKSDDIKVRLSKQFIIRKGNKYTITTS